jgi:hypothetical protein
MRSAPLMLLVLFPAVAVAGLLVPKSKGPNPFGSDSPAVYSRPYSVTYSTCGKDLPNESVSVTAKGEELCVEIMDIQAVAGGGAAPQAREGTYWFVSDSGETKPLSSTSAIKELTYCYDSAFNKYRMYSFTFQGCTANGGVLKADSTGFAVWTESRVSMVGNMGPKVKSAMVEFVFK